MNLIPTLSEQPEPSLRRWLLAQLMRLVNANPPPRWYDHDKPILLHYYGRADGYDLQRIEALCWSCGGKGTDDCGECFDCVNGIHHVTRMKLDRYVIEGVVFHQLGGKIWDDATLQEWSEEPGFRRWITGRVKHRPTPLAVSLEAHAWIALLTGHYRAVHRALLLSPASWPMIGGPLSLMAWLWEPLGFRLRLWKAGFTQEQTPLF